MKKLLKYSFVNFLNRFFGNEEKEDAEIFTQTYPPGKSSDSPGKF